MSYVWPRETVIKLLEDDDDLWCNQGSGSGDHKMIDEAYVLWLLRSI